jgi:hypothetical protein
MRPLAALISIAALVSVAIADDNLVSQEGIQLAVYGPFDELPEVPPAEDAPFDPDDLDAAYSKRLQKTLAAMSTVDIRACAPDTGAPRSFEAYYVVRNKKSNPLRILEVDIKGAKGWSVEEFGPDWTMTLPGTFLDENLLVDPITEIEYAEIPAYDWFVIGVTFEPRDDHEETGGESRARITILSIDPSVPVGAGDPPATKYDQFEVIGHAVDCRDIELRPMTGNHDKPKRETLEGDPE